MVIRRKTLLTQGSFSFIAEYVIFWIDKVWWNNDYYMSRLSCLNRHFMHKLILSETSTRGEAGIIASSPQIIDDSICANAFIRSFYSVRYWQLRLMGKLGASLLRAWVFRFTAAIKCARMGPHNQFISWLISPCQTEAKSCSLHAWNVAGCFFRRDSEVYCFIRRVRKVQVNGLMDLICFFFRRKFELREKFFLEDSLVSHVFTCKSCKYCVSAKKLREFGSFYKAIWL